MESSCDVINQVNLRARNDSFFSCGFAVRREGEFFSFGFAVRREGEYISFGFAVKREGEFFFGKFILVFGDQDMGNYISTFVDPIIGLRRRRFQAPSKSSQKHPARHRSSAPKQNLDWTTNGGEPTRWIEAGYHGPQTRPSYSSLHSTPRFTRSMKTTAPPVSSLIFPMEEQKKTTSGIYWLSLPPMGPPIRPMDLTAPLPRLRMPDYCQPIEIFPLPERERPQRQEPVAPSAFELMVRQKFLRMEREELERKAAAQEEYQRYRNTVLAEAQRLARKRRLNSMHERPAYAKKSCYSVSSYGTSWSS
ncbi:uncharacterized protein LOC108702795 isoform X2 [Xenopus laevis]|uniref:Uncharacterized protein LOC108702795 isoform X2 n=1 Tax=Xenopus laevis TaxID=8355 RepID=A0A8J1LXU9_XENLA|nr:uncharacterized protein LOC108702795 isoform X2 [Xenopus laevis]